MRNIILAILILANTTAFSQILQNTKTSSQKVIIPQNVVYNYFGVPRAPADSFIVSIEVENLGKKSVIPLLMPAKKRGIMFTESTSLPPGTKLDKVSSNDNAVVKVDRSKEWSMIVDYPDGSYYDYKILNKDSLSDQFDIAITTGKYQKIAKEWKAVPDVSYLIARNVESSDAVFKAVWILMKER